jgi:cytochrome P450
MPPLQCPVCAAGAGSAHHAALAARDHSHGHAQSPGTLGRALVQLKWMKTKFFNERTLIANHPGLVRHVLVDNAQNYRMATIRQLILRPILRDGLLTAEGETWKSSRKAMAPVFTPRHARGFAEQMLEQSLAFKDRYAATADSNAGRGDVRDVAVDMTELTFDILSATLFSGHVAGSEEEFAGDIERLLSTMGRVDPDGSAQGAAHGCRGSAGCSARRCSPSSVASSNRPWMTGRK